MKNVLLSLTTIGTLVPLQAYAQKKTLVSDGLGLSSDNLSGYFNNLFELALIVGAILAVLIIATAGLQYMTTDAVTGKMTSRERIQRAILGLLMLLGVWLFFEQINPNILNLNFQLTKTDIQLQQQTDTTSQGPLFGNNIGTSYTTPTWVDVPINQYCSDVQGGGWVGIDNRHCAGAGPSSATCCGFDPTYTPPAPIDDTGSGGWCTWDAGSSTCYDDNTSIAPGSWCYERNGGGYCYASESVCEENETIDTSASSSCFEQ